MANSVKSFTVGYDPINEESVFTCGDSIKGQITLDLARACSIRSLCIKLKGKAEVKWWENYGRTVVRFHKKEKLFTIEKFIIEAHRGDNIFPQGCHVYQFTFKIPEDDLPSSFKGTFGKIVYTLEATLSRPMRADCKAKAKLNLRHEGRSASSLIVTQNAMTEKKMNLFTSGTVAMDVNVDRTGVLPGEAIKVVASIQNKSSREIRVKYCLYMKCSYFAKRKRKLEKRDILKEVGDPIPPSTSHTATKIITIPVTTAGSILNCNILKVEYRLRVYLDVKFASDPEIKFPVIILSKSLRSEEEQQTEQCDAFGNYDLKAGSSFLQPPTTFNSFASTLDQ